MLEYRIGIYTTKVEQLLYDDDDDLLVEGR